MAGIAAGLGAGIGGGGPSRETRERRPPIVQGPRLLAAILGTPLGAMLLLLGLEAAAGAAILDAAGRAGPALLAALGNLVAGLRFGLTLLPGREPLISRYSRFDAAGMPDADGRYTRRLTRLWALLLGGFALAFLAAALGLGSAAPLARLQPLACLGLFLGEHALRRRCFPGLGPVSPLGTLRAIWRCHRRVRHAP